MATPKTAATNADKPRHPIQVRCQELKISQRTLAKKLKVHPQTVSNWVTGKTSLSMGNYLVYDLCKILKIDRDYLRNY